MPTFALVSRRMVRSVVLAPSGEELKLGAKCSHRRQRASANARICAEVRRLSRYPPSIGVMGVGSPFIISKTWDAPNGCL
jgi:hypothetical protein